MCRLNADLFNSRTYLVFGWAAIEATPLFVVVCGDFDIVRKAAEQLLLLNNLRQSSQVVAADDAAFANWLARARAAAGFRH